MSAGGKGWPARIFLAIMSVLAIALGARIVYELLEPIVSSLTSLAVLIALYLLFKGRW